MSKFRDEGIKGQNTIEWELRIDVPMLTKVREQTGVELGKIIDLESGVAEQLSDLETRVNVLWVICEEQAKKQSVSQEDFASRLFGDAFDRAEEAFYKALQMCFPKQAREALNHMVEAGEKSRDKIMSKFPQIMDRIDQDLESMLNNLATSGAESSE